MEKELILEYCKDLVNKRIQEIQTAIGDATSALQEETKSSAGDKYETSREMIQQDLNRYQQQLTIAGQDMNTLDKLTSSKQKSHAVSIGSLVQTDSGYYFMAISIGHVKIDEEEVFCISPQSPIGKLLVGLSLGDTFSFNGKTHNVVNIG